jgi:hypothetical protein
MKRCSDACFVLGSAAVATAGLALLYQRPTILCALLIILTVVTLWRWHELRDLAGLIVGAVFGNLTELSSDLAGLWVHRTPQILGLAPAYIFLCYPLLGLAFPRLVDALAGGQRAAAEGSGTTLAHACMLWVVLVSLPCLGAGRATVQWLFCVTSYALILRQFHSQHDLLCGLVGTVMALGWELPCTVAGAWVFPQAQLFGRLPLWLPFAYAGFFVTIGRMTIGMTMNWEHVRAAGRTPVESAT